MLALETTEQFCSRLKLDPETLAALESEGIVKTRIIGTKSFSAQVADILLESPQQRSSLKLEKNSAVLLRRLSRRSTSYRRLQQFVSSYGIRKLDLDQALAYLIETGQITTDDTENSMEKIYSISA